MEAVNTKDAILVLNSGSSSLKFGLFQAGDKDEAAVLTGEAKGIGSDSGSIKVLDHEGKELLRQDHLLETQSQALQTFSNVLRATLHVTPIAVGHRVVHGGPRLRDHQRITPQLLQTLQQDVHFAPLHIPQSLEIIHQAQQVFSEAVHIACFDTAFHKTLPPVACHLPLPTPYFEQGVIRYGFHGLSCESVLFRLQDALPSRVIIAHLGNGASVTAVRDGQSIDTSMGMTPTGGVPMGTRSGDLDPGVLLYLMRQESLHADALEELLNRKCGLAAFSNGESDMQALLQRASQGDVAASLAVEAFTTAVRKYIGSYAALMGGVDLLVFTGGIGEHSEAIRHSICAPLGFLGLGVADEGRNRVRRITAEEEIQIARHARRLMQTA